MINCQNHILFYSAKLNLEIFDLKESIPHYLNFYIKFGIEGLTKGMAIDLAKENIRVNTVCPTFVKTPMVKKFFNDKKFMNTMLNNIPLGRFATVNDVATAVVFLASDASSYVTGAILCVDGGYMA